MQTIVVRRGHAKPLWAGHPWVHAAGVLRVEGRPEAPEPDVVRVVDEDGRLVGRGFLAPDSAIRVRLLDGEEDPRDVDEVIRRRLDEAVSLRRRLFPLPTRTNAYRLVHAEGDGLPGLVVDRFDDVLVAQFATKAMHRRRALLAAHLLSATGARALVSRPGGFEVEEGIAKEDVPFTEGDLPDAAIQVREEGLWLRVDPRRGQKTGHYVDQRENRQRVAEVAAGGRVLDLYAGTGGFSLAALRAGATAALAVDASARALETARANARENGLASGLETREGDVRAVLARLKDEAATYDLVVLDPPNLFPRRGGAGHARKAYRDLGVQALLRTRPGGFLAVFSCSAHLDGRGLAESLATSARECRRPYRVLRLLGAGPDHPVAGAAREGRYLSGLLVQAGP